MKDRKNTEKIHAKKEGVPYGNPLEMGTKLFPYMRKHGPIREMGKGAKSATIFCGLGVLEWYTKKSLHTLCALWHFSSYHIKHLTKSIFHYHLCVDFKPFFTNIIKILFL
jgi:hypothetical protein